MSTQVKIHKQHNTFFVTLPSLENADNHPILTLIGSLLDTNLLPFVRQHNANTFQFVAASVECVQNSNRENPDSWRHAESFTHSLATQLKYFIDVHQVCPLFFPPENLFVINNTQLIYFGTDFHEICPRTGTVLLTTPFRITSDLAPEMRVIRELPARIPHQVVYYHFASAVMRVLSCGDGNPPLFMLETKWYHMMLRCLRLNPTKRTVLYV